MCPMRPPLSPCPRLSATIQGEASLALPVDIHVVLLDCYGILTNDPLARSAKTAPPTVGGEPWRSASDYGIFSTKWWSIGPRWRSAARSPMSASTRGDGSTLASATHARTARSVTSWAASGTCWCSTAMVTRSVAGATGPPHRMGSGSTRLARLTWPTPASTPLPNMRRPARCCWSLVPKGIRVPTASRSTGPPTPSRRPTATSSSRMGTAESDPPLLGHGRASPHLRRRRRRLHSKAVQSRTRDRQARHRSLPVQRAARVAGDRRPARLRDGPREPSLAGLHHRGCVRQPAGARQPPQPGRPRHRWHLPHRRRRRHRVLEARRDQDRELGGEGRGAGAVRRWQRPWRLDGHGRLPLHLSLSR